MLSFEPMSRSGARALLVASLGLLLSAGCNGRKEDEKTSRPATTNTAGLGAAPRSRAKPELLRRVVPHAPLEQFVQQHVEEADASGQRVVVYVGATWCQPCQRFHQALESGQLDESLAGMKFVEFDADRDREELRAAGYAFQYIPLFAVPDQSGHASGRAIEGSTQGEGGLLQGLAPRLLALLGGLPVD